MTADVALIPGPWADILSVNGTLSVPDPWEGTPITLDGATLVMTWRYGAAVAMTAALASLACALLLTGVLMLTRGRPRHEQDDAALALGQVSPDGTQRKDPWTKGRRDSTEPGNLRTPIPALTLYISRS